MEIIRQSNRIFTDIVKSCRNFYCDSLFMTNVMLFDGYYDPMPFGWNKPIIFGYNHPTLTLATKLVFRTM